MPTKKARAKPRALPYRRGVGVVLINAKGEVWVGSRIDTPGAWQMPQGGIDKDETPHAAALRELKEEIGTDKAEIVGVTRGWLSYDLPKRLQGKVWGGKFRGQKQKWFLMRFTGRDKHVDIGGKHPEFDKWKWLPFHELPKVIVGFKRAVYRDVAKAFAKKVAAYSKRG
jgi:putative (di)nucleoside polyphosphate hydrolase